MMPIQVTIKDNLAIVKITGELTYIECMEALKRYYAKPTQLVLWDGSAGSFNLLTVDDMEKFALYTKDHIGKRPSGAKTAVVAPTDINFGLARMSQIFYEMEDIDLEFKVVRTYKEAQDWLNL